MVKKLYQSYKKTILTIGLLFLPLSALSRQIEPTQIEQTFVQHMYGQVDVLNMLIDTIGQNMASGASNLSKERKLPIQHAFNTIRAAMDDIKRFAAIHVDPKQEYYLAEYISEMINFFDKLLKSNLKIVPYFDMEAISQKALPSEDMIAQKTEAILKSNDKRLVALIKDSESIGLSWFNKTYRGARKFYKDYYVGSIIEHTAVYSALFVWYMYVTSKGSLEELMHIEKEKRGWFANFLLKAKGYTGGEVKQLEGSVELDVKVDTPESLRALAIEDKVSPGIVQGVKSLPTNAPEGEHFQNTKATVPMSFTLNDHGVVTAALGVTKTIMTIDNKVPVFTIVPGALFAEYIKRDATKLYAFFTKLKRRFDDHFFGTTKKTTYEDLTIRTERFADIVGREDVKAEFRRVVDYICNPDRFDRAGIKVERGYLLAGEPQTGKTFMAKALAGEISAALEKQGKDQKVRLFEICTEALAKNGIAYYMELARSQAPCILFLDELDLLRLQRDGDTKTLSEFLTSMSGSLSNNEKDHVIILAATNKPENVDFALRQHGRFGKMFWFDKPTFKHRVEFFVKEFEKRFMNKAIFDFEVLAQQTEGCSFGTLDIVTKKGLMLAKLENVPVTQDHFLQAINLEVKKLIPHGYTVSSEKEEIVATRQAGKALISIILNPVKVLCTVTVLPVTQELEEEHVAQQYNLPGMKKSEQRAVRLGGIFAYHLTDALDITTQEELVKQCKILLAGNVAQKVFGLTSCAFDKNDKQEAFTLAKRIVFEGLDPKEIAKEIREAKLAAAYRLLEQYESEIEKLLEKNKKDLATIVELLKNRKTISAVEIKEAIAK